MNVNANPDTHSTGASNTNGVNIDVTPAAGQNFKKHTTKGHEPGFPENDVAVYNIFVQSVPETERQQEISFDLSNYFVLKPEFDENNNANPEAQRMKFVLYEDSVSPGNRRGESQEILASDDVGGGGNDDKDLADL